MPVRYRIVDVFSDRPLAGNALCVVLDPVPPELMAPLAREVNLSETTFPVQTGDGRYEMRIFTPLGELPFAGHPSIGTAWVLGPGRWVQRTAGATVEVESDEHGAVMTQPAPVISEVAGTGVWRAEAAGNVHALVPVERVVDWDWRRVEVPADATTLAFMARVDDSTLHVRCGVPGLGGFEDPGTGSAAGPIAVLAHQLWGTEERVTVEQGDEIGRPCRIAVELGSDGPRVGGAVAACAEGVFDL